MVKNVKRYMKQQKKDVLPGSVADFVPVTYILPQVSCPANARHGCKDTYITCTESGVWKISLMGSVMHDAPGLQLVC